MLITLTPTYQAVTRPITSVRFFRVLCLSLFGLNPKTNNIVELFLNGKLYWTHYHKCYFDDYWAKKKDLPSYCYEKYLLSEISLIKPELIIILGKKTLEKIYNSVLSGNRGKILGYDFIYREFPETGMEDTFIEVRNELKKYIPEVDSMPIPKYFKMRSNNDIGKLGVHVYFEIRNLEKQLKMIKENMIKCIDETDIDERWYNNYLIPASQRSSFIVDCFSFIEYTIKPLCLELNIDISNEHVWQLFIEFCSKTGISKNSRQLVDRCSNDIRNLSEVRNLILHEGSYKFYDYNNSYAKLRECDNNFGKYFFNTLVVSDSECDKALELVKRFVNILFSAKEKGL